jgi:endonuclease I
MAVRLLLRSLLFLLSTLACLAAPPPGYYAAAEGLTGQALRTALNGIISGHTVIPYSWPPYHQLDEDPSNPANVLLCYSGFSLPKVPDNTFWNREHIWPRSRGVGDTGPAYSDLHHLLPCDAGINSSRGNLAFGWADPTDSGYRPPGYYPKAPLDSKDSKVWQASGIYRGLLARMLCYMDVRYAGMNGEPDLALVENPPSTSPWGFQMGRLSTLLEWHRAHPPTEYERRRNQRIFANWQGNRNPFIDYPDLVDAVFTSTLYLAPGTWRVANFTFGQLDDPSVSGWSADPDGDGLPNLLEYAFGTDPHAPTPAAALAGIPSGASWSLDVKQVRSAAVWGLTYTIEVSTDLETWSVPSGVSTQTISDQGDYRIERYTFTAPGSGVAYGRVRVAMP